MRSFAYKKSIDQTSKATICAVQTNTDQIGS